ncbi:MAG: isoprenylcysteine carboxylmethyltransferase family protein [Verrucomicrobia bacterium]|nr:isoprenylcysteine carboxylmethyltransferase family protein [Verrucomicrobiota bacterium]
MWSGFFQRGGAWVLAQSVLVPAVLGLAILLPGDWGGSWPRVAGGLLGVLGAFFGLAGVAVLGRNRSAFPKPRPGSRLVRHGIYARVRHPLYTSGLMLTFGWALWWQSGLALLAAGGLILFIRAKVRREEEWLREQFPEYPEYARRVPAFLPRIRRCGRTE